MKNILLTSIMLSSALLADEVTKFSEIEFLLKSELLRNLREPVKVATKDDAEKVLLSEIRNKGRGISAQWKWLIRDAYMLPNNWEGIGKAGEVVWIGQLNEFPGLSSQPSAMYFINATTGRVFVIERPLGSKAKPE